MPEYSSTTITPSDGVQVPSMNGNTAGNILLSALKSYMLSGAGQANGLATLGPDGKLTAAQLPDLADDVIVVTTYANLPSPGTAAKIYITADTNYLYRWDPDLDTPAYIRLADLTDYARIEDIQQGYIQAGIAVKAFQDAMGRAIITTYATKAELSAEESSREAADSNLKSAIQKNTAEIENLKQTSAQTEITVSYPDDGNYPALMPNLVPAKSAKYAEIKSIVGKSRAMNNTFDPSGFASSKTQNNVTFTNNGDGTVTIQTTAEGASDGTIYVIATNMQIVSGKAYILGVGVSKAGVSLTNSITSSLRVDDIAYDYKTCDYTSAYVEFRIFVTSGTIITTPIIAKPMLRNLELTFPEGVPNSLAGCLAKCPDLLKYDAYGQSIVDTTVEGVKSVGVNIWDEETEIGSLYFTDGTKNDTVTNALRSKNYITVRPDTSYYLIDPTGARSLRFCYYSEDGTFISSSSWVGGITGYLTITTPSSCTKMLMAIDSAYGTTYNHNIQICLNSLPDAVKQAYHAHMTDTLTLPSPVTLRSAGSVAEEYDLETGKKTNPLESVDLEQISFTLYEGSDYWFFIGYVDNSKPAQSSPSVVTQMTSMYKSVTTNSIGYADNTISFTNVTLRIRTDSKTNPPKGILSYELATPDGPTQLTPVINNTIQVEGNGTVETVQTQTPVLDNSMTVNFDLIP